MRGFCLVKGTKIWGLGTNGRKPTPVGSTLFDRQALPWVALLEFPGRPAVETSVGVQCSAAQCATVVCAGTFASRFVAVAVILLSHSLNFATAGAVLRRVTCKGGPAPRGTRTISKDGWL